MEVESENPDEKNTTVKEEHPGTKDNEELGREIPTVTPDDDDEDPKSEGEKPAK